MRYAVDSNNSIILDARVHDILNDYLRRHKIDNDPRFFTMDEAMANGFYPRPGMKRGLRVGFIENGVRINKVYFHASMLCQYPAKIDDINGDIINNLVKVYDKRYGREVERAVTAPDTRGKFKPIPPYEKEDCFLVNSYFTFKNIFRDDGLDSYEADVKFCYETLKSSRRKSDELKSLIKNHTDISPNNDEYADKVVNTALQRKWAKSANRGNAKTNF